MTTRTITDIENDLRQAKIELEPIERARDEAVKKVNKFYHELEKYKIDNNMYRPMSDLLQYANRNINNIKLVEEYENGTLNVENMYGDEFFKVTEKGYLSYSSEYGGVMDYNESENAYVMWCRYMRTVRKFIGFMEIDIEEEN